MNALLIAAWILLLEGGLSAWAQTAQTFVLGGPTRSWRSGGVGTDPTFVLNAFSGEVQRTNSPDGSIDYAYSPVGSSLCNLMSVIISLRASLSAVR